MPNEPRETPVILVVDDEELVRGLLRDVLTRNGYEVLEAANGRQAIRLCQTSRIDLIITDLAMPEWEGLETLRAAGRKLPGVPVIVVSGMIAASMFLRTAQLLGAAAVFEKPLNMGALLDTVRRLLGRAREQ